MEDHQTQKAADVENSIAALIASERCPFGPSFFLQHLGALVRDRCPAADERLPRVAVHLTTGDVLDVCHVAAIAPRWVVLVTRDAKHPAIMINELIPYEAIHRVRICDAPVGRAGSIGFDPHHQPTLLVTPSA